jgi:ketosteroid isomerase-like protein
MISVKSVAMLDPDTVNALRSTAARYASGLDNRDTALFLSAFAPDATFAVEAEPGAPVSPSVRHGHAELAALPQGLRRYARTHHMLGQHDYALTSSGVTGCVYCTARHLSRGGAQDAGIAMFIRYLDEYVPAGDGQWLIRARRVVIDWTQTSAAD